MVLNTFAYIFDRHHRSGIYVSIRGNSVRRFMSFSNPKYVNPVAGLMAMDPAAKAAVKAAGGAMNPDKRRWNALDCLVVGALFPRPDAVAAPGHEPSYNYSEVLYFLELACPNVFRRETNTQIPSRGRMLHANTEVEEKSGIFDHVIQGASDGCSEKSSTSNECNL